MMKLKTWIIWKRLLAFAFVLQILGILFVVFADRAKTLSVVGDSKSDRIIGYINQNKEIKGSLDYLHIKDKTDNHKTNWQMNIRRRGTTEKPRDITKSRKCSCDERPPEDLAEKQTFYEMVAGSSYVFSSYYDTRGDRNEIVSMGIVHSVSGVPAFCTVWIKGQEKPEHSPLSYKKIPEYKHATAFPTLFTCPWRNTSKVPYAVSLVRKICEPITNVLPVTQTESGNHFIKDDFHVCVSPLNYLYNNVTAFVETVELHKLLGAQKQVFYNYSVGPDLNKVLQYYRNKNIIDVVQWPLPVRNNTDKSKPPLPLWNVYYYAQLLSLNDCMYRSFHRAKHVVVVDMDEKIIPRQPDVKNWKQMIDKLNPKNVHICYYLFRNTFFRTDWSLDHAHQNTSLVNQLGLISLLATKRERLINAYKVRSKYIADTRYVETAGIHFPWKCRYDKSIYSPEAAGLVHHYRRWDDSPETKLNSIQDKIAFKFGAELVDKTYNIYKDMAKKGIHPVGDIPPPIM